jgi:hypothetical protein
VHRVSFNNEFHTTDKDNSKSPKGIPKKPKPRQIKTELDVIQRQHKLSHRAAQLAEYLVRFQKKTLKHHKHIIESNNMKYDQEKILADEKEYFSYIHPKYPFIRLNHPPKMVEALFNSYLS